MGKHCVWRTAVELWYGAAIPHVSGADMRKQRCCGKTVKHTLDLNLLNLVLQLDLTLSRDL